MDLCEPGTKPVTITGIQKKYYYNGNNDVSCSSASDGQISISAWGGTGTLQYSADNGATFQTSNVISGLSAGTYQVVVKDANGCMGTSSITLRAPSPVSGTIVAQTPTLFLGTNKGTATIAGAGGVGLYYYSIDGGAFQWSGTFTNLAAGSHSVLVRDNNGCMGLSQRNYYFFINRCFERRFNIISPELLPFECSDRRNNRQHIYCCL